MAHTPTTSSHHPRAGRKVRVVVADVGGASDLSGRPDNQIDTDDLTDTAGDCVEVETRVVEAAGPGGTATAWNEGTADLGDVDHVALVLSGTRVAPGWLARLVAAVDADPMIGVAVPRIVFEPRFVAVELSAETFSPEDDQRPLAVRVSGVEVDGEDRWPAVVWSRGAYPPEAGGPGEPTYRWCDGDARVLVPVGGVGDDSAEVRVRLAAEHRKSVQVRAGGGHRTIEVTDAPAWFELGAPSASADVISSAGRFPMGRSALTCRGRGEEDVGQFDYEADVFGWRAGAVALSRAYLEDVGRFDPTLFDRPEETATAELDLAWRGRARGWRHVYVPAAVLRRGLPEQGDAEAGDDPTRRRNRLLHAVRNGDRSVVRAELAAAARDRALGPLAAAVAHAPAAFAARRRAAARWVLPPDAVTRWRGAR